MDVWWSWYVHRKCRVSFVLFRLSFCLSLDVCVYAELQCHGQLRMQLHTEHNNFSALPTLAIQIFSM